MGSATRDLLDNRELWVALAVALIAVDVLALREVPRSELAAMATIAVASAVVAFGPGSLVVVVLFALLAAQWSASGPPVLPVLVSLAAAGATYACVPDTERALVVLGTVLGVGAVAVVWHWDWGATAVVVSGALVWVAITDGTPRASAVIGALGIAAIHHLLQVAMADGRRPVAALLVGGGAMAVSSRVAGVGDGWLMPLTVVLACGAVTVGAVLLARPGGVRGEATGGAPSTAGRRQ